MDSVKSVLKNFNPTVDKYVSREFQTFGIHLADTLDDHKHKSLYIKLAKTTPRALLERALSFACDSTATRKGALFMWKLKQLKDEAKTNVKKIDKSEEMMVKTMNESELAKDKELSAKPGTGLHPAKGLNEQ
jgi:hypothetical protein